MSARCPIPVRPIPEESDGATHVRAASSIADESPGYCAVLALVLFAEAMAR